MRGINMKRNKRQSGLLRKYIEWCERVDVVLGALHMMEDFFLPIRRGRLGYGMDIDKSCEPNLSALEDAIERLEKQYQEARDRHIERRKRHEAQEAEAK